VASLPAHAIDDAVTEGMDAVDSIRNVKTARRGMHDDVPVEAVVIHSARRA
jgi:cyclophilin family peptidyl-prolyl cis-trans isomerase